MAHLDGYSNYFWRGVGPEFWNHFPFLTYRFFSLKKGWFYVFFILPAQPQDLVSYSFLLSSSSFFFFFFTLPVTPAGSCFLLVSSFFILPAQPQDLVSYSFLSSFFFFLLLATRVFHTFPYILFWPNLVTMTGTLTTTQAQKMVGSGVTMGSLGSKRSFAPKRHQVLQIT